MPSITQEVFDCEKPVAFVTGSQSPRVGQTIARFLVESGFEVVTHGRTARSASQGEPLCMHGDLADESCAQEWCEQIVNRFGRIDLVVNSAAIWEPKSLEETQAEDYLEFFRVNSLASALICQQFGLQMARQASGGCLLNIGDWATKRPYKDFPAYFVSKGSIKTLTRTMAVELASRNPRVRVNAILPGPVLLADEISPERESQIVAESLLKRAGTADDVARAVYFLATSPFITGVCLPVDGGRSIFAGANQDAIAHPRFGE
ncbi:MAG: SDR family oxidoreductase [Planctomycetota bacterium]|nr:SDR family oxidoreductase [Planctomycetota bacterium]